MLKIYNSLSKTKEVFQPLQQGKVGIYVCGMTVYDHCHLGHARSMVSFDVVVRHLRAIGYDVHYVRNITDIDDKIIERAAKNEESVTALTTRFIDLMHQDEAALNISPPDVEPRATEYVEKIIAFIEGLIAKGFAYQSSNGDVYYEVSKFAEYGKLSHKDIEGQEAGARVDVVEVKRAPLDFVLWKQAKAGEPSWPSPWGEGRPGWHIECSAMSNDCLGEQFDIHGGGFDLQFPHHENEIAQSEALHGKTFANLWMHVGFLQVNREKMSKSLGNFFTIDDVLQRYHPETVRYFLLSSHYRSQLNYSTDNLNHAQTALERLYQALRGIEHSDSIDETWVERFNQAMNDDFNTPEALAVLFEMTHLINRGGDNAPALAATLKHLAGTLGLLEQTADEFLHAGIDDENIAKIENLISERLLARSEKNWQRADEIRDILQADGIELEDGAEGTNWRRSSEL